MMEERVLGIEDTSSHNEGRTDRRHKVRFKNDELTKHVKQQDHQCSNKTYADAVIGKHGDNATNATRYKL